MAEPYLSEIRIFSFDFPPKGWAFCNGQLLPINQNQALFSLLGTTFGGNGQTSFALPNYQGRVPIHVSGTAFTLGQSGGEEAHTLTISEMPQHTHAVVSNNGNGDQPIPADRFFAATPNSAYHAASGNLTSLPDAVTSVGGSQPHLNMQPYLALNFCIALQGIYPDRN